MAELLVNVVKIEEITPHENAESLEVVIIGGWNVVVKKEQFKLGDIAVYFPPDCVLKQELSDQLGVTNYLSSKGRVKAIKLRSHPSHGFLACIKDFGDSAKKWKVGDNVAEKLGVVKWEEELSTKKLLQNRDRVLPEIPEFTKYTDIENYRNHTTVFTDDDVVAVTCKIHGSNVRIGLVNGEFCCGSHNMRRLVETTLWRELKFHTWKWIRWCIAAKRLVPYKFKYDATVKHLYKYPLEVPGVKELLQALTVEHKATSVTLYGEIFGDVQDLKYGRKPGEYDFAAFDIKINGVYIPYMDFKYACDKFYDHLFYNLYYKFHICATF